MTVIGTPTPERSRPHIEVTFEQFEHRLAARGHASDEIRRLWEELTEAEPEVQPTRALGLGPLIAVYLGLLLVVAAAVSLLGIYWEELGAPGILALGLLFLAGSLAGSEILRRRQLPQPADVLEAVAIGWVALVAFAVEWLAGVLSVEGDLHHVHIWTIAGAAIVAGLVLMALRPDPLLFVPLALAVSALTLDAAVLVFGDDLSDRQRWGFMVPVGLAWIAGGLWLDVTGRRSYATWAHWAGLITFGVAMLVIVPKTVPGFAVIGVLGAVSLFFSVFVRHWSFTVVGAIGVLLATFGTISLIGGMVPLVIAVVGIAFVVVGLRWSRWHERIRVRVLSHMPPAARSFVTRLAP